MARAAIGILLAALIGGAGVWVTWARETPTKAEVVELIKNNNPYESDAKLLQHRINANSEQLDKLEVKVDSLQKDVSEVMGVLRALSKQLDEIEKKLDKK